MYDSKFLESLQNITTPLFSLNPVFYSIYFPLTAVHIVSLWCYYFIRSDPQYSFKAILMSSYLPDVVMVCMQMEMRQSFCQRFSVFLDRRWFLCLPPASALNAMRNAALFWAVMSGSICQTLLCQLWKWSMAQTLIEFFKKPFKEIKLCFSYSCQAW